MTDIALTENEKALIDALVKLREAETKQGKCITGTMRIALLRATTELSSTGLPLFTKAQFKQQVIDVYGFTTTAAGKVSKSLADTPRKHCQQFDMVLDNLGEADSDIRQLVNVFIHHVKPTSQAASFGGLIKDIKASIAKVSKAKTDAAGVVPPVADADSDVIPPSAWDDVAPTPNIGDIIAQMQGVIEGLTVAQVTEFSAQLASLHDAIGTAWENASVEVQEAIAA